MRSPLQRPPRPFARRSGFTLIEVAMAVTILGLATIALMAASARMIRGVTDDRTETIAAAAADARLAEVRQWPTYGQLIATFAGTEGDTPQPGWTRTTQVVRTGGPTQDEDYMRITVSVTGPRLASPVTRTTSIAAP